MKIARSERVLYAHNPLAEVVCQLRFDRISELEAGEPVGFQSHFPYSQYPARTIEHPVGIAFRTGDTGPVNISQPSPPRKVFSMASDDASWRISLCSDFVSLTCMHYESWDDFLPRILDVVAQFTKCYPDASPKRLGLRYKDVIEREPLGLGDAPWHELVKPFLLGPLAPGALSDESAHEDEIAANVFQQSILPLEDCLLLLQGSFLRSHDGSRKAFLIDADFYLEGAPCEALLAGPEAFRHSLDKLHNNAGALFRRCITERLHHALGPGRK
jgi:uncharacterized protein (TIGR04255 family)